MFYILLIFVLQISYCSAQCVCPGVVVLPHYAIILIGLTTGSLFIATVALAVVVYRLRRGHNIEPSIFGKAKLSISKYQRQESGNRMILRDSLNDDTEQLNSSEDMNNEDSDGIIANEVRVETEPKRTPKINQTPKIPIFPQIPKEQINEICEAVLSRHRKKEFTSLSELDKIVSEAKAEKPKVFDTSASTPDLDAFDDPSPIPVKKLPVFDANSKESKLRDEMKAMFNQDQFKSKLKNSKNNPETDMDTIDSKETKENLNDNEIILKGLNKTDEILSKVERNFKNEMNCDSLKFKADVEKEAFIGNKEKTGVELSQAEINSKRINLAIMAKFNHGGLKSKVKVEDSISCNDTNTENKDVVQDDIYDCPPPPRLQNEVYDFLPSPKRTANDFPSSSNQSDELFDFPSSPKPESDELYDFPPSPKPHNAMYDCVPSPQRKRIVSDGNATGYLVPLSDPNLELFEGPQYSNAKSVSDKDFL